MVRSADFVCVSNVSGCWKNTLWKASISNRHKTKQASQQGKWADKAGRLTRQSGLPNLFQTCLLHFVPATSTLVLLKCMFRKLICVEQSTSLRYLWQHHIQLFQCILISKIDRFEVTREVVCKYKTRQLFARKSSKMSPWICRWAVTRERSANWGKCYKTFLRP